MANYYSNSTNGARSRFGFRFNSGEGANDARTDPWASSDLYAKSDPHRDHVCRPVVIGSDGRAMPGVFGYPPPKHHHHHKETTTVTEESAYRVQPVSPHTKKNYVPGDRKMGFPGGLFQRPRAEYVPSEPALTTDGEWARPSPTGWKLPPEEPLRKVINDIDSASSRPTSSSVWAGPSPRGRLERVTNDISTAAGYVSGPIGPVTASGAGRRGPNGLFSEYGGKKISATIDSREAVKRYRGQYI